MPVRSRSLPARVALLLATGLPGCSPAAGGEAGVPAWPDSLPAASAFGAPRGLLPRRAILHVHSVYSHDACDEAAQDEAGRTNEPCLRRFRDALCRSRVDAAFLTEHDRWLVRADSLTDALLFRPGDRPAPDTGRAVANRLPCGTLLFAGAENALMPVGLDSLPRGSLAERRAFYEAGDADAAERFRRFGATVLLSHPEDLPLERIAELDPDGLEVYNPHANFAPKHRESQGFTRLGAFAGLAPFILRLTRAHPDLALLAIFRANRQAIDRWDGLLTQRMVFGFGASDAHENALPVDLADGDRGDSYARLLPWVTNVLLTGPAAPSREGESGRREAVPTGGVASGPRSGTSPARPGPVEDALRQGRSYAVIEAWGTPTGFDFHLRGPDGVTEMGETVELHPGQRIVAIMPALFGRSNVLPEPEVRLRVFRVHGRARRILADARESVEVAVPGPGAYRVEVGIVPRHLAPYLGEAADRYIREVPWIYSNPIRVVGDRIAGG